MFIFVDYYPTFIDNTNPHYLEVLNMVEWRVGASCKIFPEIFNVGRARIPEKLQFIGDKRYLSLNFDHTSAVWHVIGTAIHTFICLILVLCRNDCVYHQTFLPSDRTLIYVFEWNIVTKLLRVTPSSGPLPDQSMSQCHFQWPCVTLSQWAQFFQILVCMLVLPSDSAW